MSGQRKGNECSVDADIEARIPLSRQLIKGKSLLTLTSQI